MRRSVLFAGLALVASGLSTLVFAHSGATGIVKERMDSMSAMGKTVKGLAAMMRGDVDYDADAVRDGAATIRSHAGDALTRLFPKGSLGHKSEAKPGIWSDWETFSALARQLAVYADGLEAAAGNGPMSGARGDMMSGDGSGMMGSADMMTSGGMMGTASPMMDAGQLAQMPADGVFTMVTQTCSSCHTKFRAEKH